jgi:hypothetical protein
MLHSHHHHHHHDPHHVYMFIVLQTFIMSTPAPPYNENNGPVFFSPAASLKKEFALCSPRVDHPFIIIPRRWDRAVRTLSYANIGVYVD